MISGFAGDSAREFVGAAGLEVIRDEKFFELAKRYAVKADGSASLPMAPAETDAPGSVGKSLGICYARVKSR